MRPHHERHESEKHDCADERLVTPQRFARVVGDDLRDDSHRRKNQHVHLRMGEEPEEVLPQNRIAAAGVSEDLSADDETSRKEKARVRNAIHELQHAGRLERRKCEQQQERCDELRPHEERETHERHPFRAQLNDRDEKVYRAEKR